MSIAYSARVGYGFLVDLDEQHQMTDEVFEEFVDSDFAVRIDGYADTSKYFFGLTKFSLDPGEAVSIPTKREYDPVKFSNMLNEFKYFCPNRDNYVPKDYVIFSVD
jgi:hypothetical protein